MLEIKDRDSAVETLRELRNQCFYDPYCESGISILQHAMTHLLNEGLSEGSKVSHEEVPWVW